MLNMFRALSDRVAALFATHVALDYEQQFLLHQSDRKVELIRKAQELEERGLHDLAVELREQADQLSLQRPLSSVLPATDELQGRLLTSADVPQSSKPVTLPAPRKPQKRSVKKAR